MNVIHQKYGQTLEPIFSVGAGYQIYFPRIRDTRAITVGNLREDTMGKKDSQILFHQSATGSRFNAQPVLGFYPGNYMLSQRFRDDQAGFLSTRDADSLISNFKTQQMGKSKVILERYLGSVKPDFQGVIPDAIRTSKVDAGEEQYRAVGGTKAAAGKYGAKSVDLVKVPGLGNVQVTTQKLTLKGHHGLYGKHHSKMQSEIKMARSRFKSHKNDDKLYNDIAKAGLKYFKSSVPTWNKALAAIKRELENAGKTVTASSLSKEIRNIKADTKPDRVAKKAISRMSTSAAHFQAKEASKIALQAIGNLQYFGDTGVLYSYQLEPYVYAAFGQFIMNPNTYQFNTAALDVARIVSGVYDLTDMQYNMVGSAQSVAMQRAFANSHFRVTGVEGKTKTNEINTGHTGGQFANHARFMSSIDLVHADKQMHQFITKGLIPEVRKHIRKSGQHFSSSKLSLFSDRVPFRRGWGWALPYISIFDTEMEKFGVQR